MQALSQDRNMWTQKDEKKGEERKEERQQERLKYIESWKKDGRKRGEVKNKRGKERERVREEERKERIEENCTHPLYPWTSTVKPWAVQVWAAQVTLHSGFSVCAYRTTPSAVGWVWGCRTVDSEAMERLLIFMFLRLQNNLPQIPSDACNVAFS